MSDWNSATMPLAVHNVGIGDVSGIADPMNLKEKRQPMSMNMPETPHRPIRRQYRSSESLYHHMLKKSLRRQTLLQACGVDEPIVQDGLSYKPTAKGLECRKWPQGTSPLKGDLLRLKQQREAEWPRLESLPTDGDLLGKWICSPPQSNPVRMFSSQLSSFEPIQAANPDSIAHGTMKWSPAIHGTTPGSPLFLDSSSSSHSALSPFHPPASSIPKSPSKLDVVNSFGDSKSKWEVEKGESFLNVGMSASEKPTVRRKRRVDRDSGIGPSPDMSDTSADLQSSLLSLESCSSDGARDIFEISRPPLKSPSLPVSFSIKTTCESLPVQISGPFEASTCQDAESSSPLDETEINGEEYALLFKRFGCYRKRLSTVQEGESHSESEEVCPPQGSLQQNIGRKCGVDPWLDLGYVEELGDEAGIDTTECTSQLSRSNVTSMGSRAGLNIDAESISDWQDVQPNEIGTKLPFCPTICRTRNENSLHSMFPKLALAQEAMHSQDVVPIPVVQPAWDRACEVRRSAGVDSMVAEWRGAAASYPGLSLLRLRLKQLIGRKMGEDKLDVLRELGTRDLRHVIRKILLLLHPRDIRRVRLVSSGWKCIVDGEKKFLLRYWCKQASKKPPRSSAFLLQHPVEAKKISHSGQRDDERCPLYCTFFPSQNLPLTNSTELPRTTDPATEFIEIACSLPQGEHIRVCPRCRGPARFKPPSVHAVCQRSSCHFDFCIRCYCAFHSSCTCQYSSRSMSHVHRRDPSPCLSRKDGRRKSLRRL